MKVKTGRLSEAAGNSKQSVQFVVRVTRFLETTQITDRIEAKSV